MGSGAKISLFPLILAICVAVIIISIVIVVVILTKKKKNTRINVNDDFINELIKYYGNKEIYLDLSKIDINMFEDLYYDPEKELDDMEDYDL